MSIELTDAQVIARAEQAGFKWLPPDEEEGGFPGGFDMSDIDNMRKLLAASPADQGGWQPIETAPKDGTEILLFRGAEIFEGKPVAERVTSGAWIELIETASEYHATTGEYLGQSIQGGEASWMSWDGGFREDAPPTHWMPLPPAPAMSASREGA